MSSISASVDPDTSGSPHSENQAPLTIDTKTPLHFIGIGGIGMSGLAKLLLESGFTVSGSDLAENKQTDLLKSLGATIYKGHQADQLPSDAIIILSSSINTENPEIKQALARQQKIYHRSDLLREIFQGQAFAHQKTFGVSGTHGKTTITGMAGLAMEAAGFSPTVVVGGNVPDWQTNARLGSLTNGKRALSIAELDESDGTIIKYTPDVTIVSNLELDHADHYHDGLTAIKKTFTKFLNALSGNSDVIFSVDCPETLALAKQAPSSLKKIFYTERDLSDAPAEIEALFSIEGASALYWLKNVRHHGFGAYQGYVYKQEKTAALLPSQLLGELHLNVVGLHNLSNALSVVAASDQLGADFELTSAALRKFTGMGRRFENVGKLQVGEITSKEGIARLIDDYAHHPTEVRATLQAARESVRATGGNVIAVFQPHRYSRLKALWEDFCTCFDAASHIIITDVYAASEQPIEGMSAEVFSKAIKHPATRAEYLPLEPGQFNQIRKRVLDLAKPGDVILSMGAGNITQLFRNWSP
ncbi:MAG: UDP-N-acetylmuramate--L-alanine ligase [Vampirovibrionales bacterium]|nr:UDP-N-acetylmuramate--L-alanine ligase [Vampirovibrionales bacterium]